MTDFLSEAPQDKFKFFENVSSILTTIPLKFNELNESQIDYKFQ